MPKSSKKILSILQLLADKSAPLEQRSMLLRTLMTGTDPDHIAAVHALLDNLTVANPESVYNEKLKQLNELLELMQSGPMRNATFIDLVKAGNVQPVQAFVV